MKRETWSSRSAFILAAVGSAVGLGNAWRFPGLAAKHGGGTFLIVYLVAMVVLGIPLLMMEISIGRKLRQGAPGAMRGLNKKLEPIGWAATTNAFVIATYYAAVFAWVIIMAIFSFKFAGLTGNTEGAGNLFAETTKTTWTVSGYSIPWISLLAIVIAWALIYYCIRNGASSVGKVVKYTVFTPVILLAILAIKGMTMPGAGAGLAQLFVPVSSAFADASLWVDAVGQVFYSMSIMMAIMFAYGSFLNEDSNIATDAIIIAVSDMAVSVLSGIVMFTTMSGTGMMNNMSDSGIATAFIIYPQAIVNLTHIGWINALFGIIFYITLITLAIDSAFSIVEGVSTAISDKFKISPKKTTIGVCIAAGIISLLYMTRAGLAWLDIVDHWTNQFNMLIIGVLECIAVGWVFKPKRVCNEINRNTNKFRMNETWFSMAIKFFCPILLTGLFAWNIIALFKDNGGIYGGYPLWSNVAGGWAIMVVVFISGFIVKGIVNSKKKKGFVEKEISWDNAPVMENDDDDISEITEENN